MIVFPALICHLCAKRGIYLNPSIYICTTIYYIVLPASDEHSIIDGGAKLEYLVLPKSWDLRTFTTGK